MTRLFAALPLVFVVACSGDAITTPSSVLSESGSIASGSSGLHALPPTVVPDGVSCPTDAPKFIRVSTHDGSLDVEWSQIPRISGYQVDVQRWESIEQWKSLPAIEVRENDEAVSLRPKDGTYRVRVRSRVCGGFGNWSVFDYGSIGSRPPTLPPSPAPKPPVDPDPCALTLRNHPPSPQPPQPPVCK